MSAKPLQVFKFGGVSVGSPEAIRLAHDRVREAAPRVAVVVSAMSGVTDLLLGAARSALAGETARASDACEAFRGRHREVVEALITRATARSRLLGLIEASAEELEAICRSVSVLRELTARTLDAAAARGERVLARIFAAYLEERGVPCAYVDAAQVVFTVRSEEALWPDLARCERAARRRLGPLLVRGKVVVVPGFIGRGPQGEVVTLGRGGSDFSASILARSLGARQVVLYKDVDGLMTADPKAVPDARVLPELHYREAAELAFYGAKVLHPRTMIPLVERGIPLFIKNTFNPSFSGTRISADAKAGAYPVKALTAVRGQALVSVEGNGMMGVPGIAARTFAALARAGHSVSMISQASSEASICFVVPAAEAEGARRALQDAFARELEAGAIDAVTVEKPVALVAVVGLGMAGQPGIAARTAAPLAREKVNIRAIAQGSSELNITLALRDEDAPLALRALHQEFQLEKLRPLPDPGGRVASVSIFGFGNIGRALARQLAQQERYFRHDLGLEIHCVALGDRTGLKISAKGFAAEELRELADRKAGGGALFARRPLGAERLAAQLSEKLFQLPLARPVFVDCTATDGSAHVQAALDHGMNVVLANKKPLAGPQADFDRLFETARRKRLMLRHEATAGAGLPVFDTLEKLEQAGDPVSSVLGCLSGTLGFLMTELEEGVPFSQAVLAAKAAGYTEPDPRDDLSGIDVARKALILARTLNLKAELADVRVEPLFPPEMADLSPEEFLARLPELDGEYARRVRAARKRRRVLRFVASIRPGELKVGLEEVPESSPVGRLRGPDNQVVLTTRRYSQNPLVVTGPGAGAEVTAAGVLNDIVAIASAGEGAR